MLSPSIIKRHFRRNGYKTYVALEKNRSKTEKEGFETKVRDHFHLVDFGTCHFY